MLNIKIKKESKKSQMLRKEKKEIFVFSVVKLRRASTAKIERPISFLLAVSGSFFFPFRRFPFYIVI